MVENDNGYITLYFDDEEISAIIDSIWTKGINEGLTPTEFYLYYQLKKLEDKLKEGDNY